MKLITIATISAALFASSAFARCGAGSKTLFSCVTANGKQIELCDAGKTIDYSFGKPQGKPEIALKVPRGQASTSQWAGVGRYESYSVEIPNGSTTYSVFWGVDRLSEKHAVEAGVDVTVNSQPAATVKCSGKNIINNIPGVDLKAAE